MCVLYQHDDEYPKDISRQLEAFLDADTQTTPNQELQQWLTKKFLDTWLALNKASRNRMDALMAQYKKQSGLKWYFEPPQPAKGFNQILLSNNL